MTEKASRRSWRAGSTAWAVAVALVAFGSSVASLVFNLRPDLKGDPRTQVGASLSVFAVDPGVPEGQYYDDLPLSAVQRQREITAACGGAPTCPAISSPPQFPHGNPGMRIYVATTVLGFKSRTVAMRLSLYDAASHVRVPEISNREVAQEMLNSPSDQSVVPAWLNCPPDSSRRYFVRAEVYHRGDGVLLAVGDSRPFLPTGC